MAWDETGLSGLQAQLAHEMLSRVTAFTFGPEVRLVRGVVTSPDRPGTGRVVIWDGRRLDSSVAYDVPLTDPQGGNIPPEDLAAASAVWQRTARNRRRRSGRHRATPSGSP